jgi:outer membrane immunogenic protein
MAALALSVSAHAADFAVKAEPAPVWTWTGFYIGGNAGAGWGTTETTLTSIAGGGAAGALNFPFAQNSRSGFLGGGQAGFNYQTGWIVAGVQADFDALAVKGTTPCLIYLSCTSNSDWLATVSGRIGGVIGDRTLVYIKGGAAWLNTKQSLNLPSAGLGGLGGLGALSGLATGATSTSVGGLLGMGVEYMFTRNWTAFLEYDYMDFAGKNVAFSFAAVPGATINANVVNKLSIAKAGLNYKF